MRNFIFYQIALLLAVFFFTGPAGAEMTNEAKEEFGIEMTRILRAARAVVSNAQNLINDPTKGFKGMTPDKVIEVTKLNYGKSTGNPFELSESGTLRWAAQRAMLAAVREVMEKAQPMINEKGKGFKGFIPAIFSKQVTDIFNMKMGKYVYLRVTAPKGYLRNQESSPDDWEDNVMEKIFKKAGYPKDTPYTAKAPHKGRTAFRLIIPEYYKESCLKCHGEPKGEKDITGGKKEGGKLGDVGGAISFVFYD